MGMVVSLFLALAAMVVVYGWLGQGGGVAGLVFFGIAARRAPLVRVAQTEVLTSRRPQARVATTCRYSGSITSARSPAVLASSRKARRSAVSAASPSGPTFS